MSIADVDNYLNHKFIDIKGWCAPHLWNAIQPIHEWQLKERVFGPIAEIGVFHGKFFIGLALTKLGSRPHVAMDVFDMQHLNLDGAGKGDLDIFKENLEISGVFDDVYIKRTDSMAVNREDIDEIRKLSGGFSMFSVDGCHTVEHTINDFNIAMELTLPGGVIFLDDYLNMDWPGVGEGLSRLFFAGSPRFVPLAYTSNKLICAHISHHKRMLAFLTERIKEIHPEVPLKLVKRFGYESLNIRPNPNSKNYIII